MTNYTRLAARIRRKSKRVGRCLEWQGHCRTSGYGVIGYDRQQKYVHRVVYEIANGPIPDGMFVCHKCDNRKCIEVSHLFLGTGADNMADMVSKGRSAAGRKNGRARLSTRKIKSILADSRPHAEIAKDAGVSPSHISRIKNGERWRHLHQP